MFGFFFLLESSRLLLHIRGERKIDDVEERDDVVRQPSLRWPGGGGDGIF